MRKKLKNKSLFKVLSLFAIVAVVLFVTAQSGFCDAETTLNAKQAADMQKDMITKIVIAALGVAISSIAIWIIGSIYNKFFVDRSLFPSNDKDDVLNTPKTVEEAVAGFIKRNRLQ